MSTRLCCACCGAALPEPALVAPDRLHGTPGWFSVAICPTCGAGRTLPVVEAAELGRFYPDHYMPHTEDRPGGIAARISAFVRTRQERHAFATPPLDAVGRMPGGRALDVGCGRGDLGASLIARGWSADGIEPAPEACAIARRRGMNVREGTVADAAPSPGSYDLVVFIHSLEHTVDPVEDLRAITAALRPGGVVAITVPNFGSWQARRFRGRWFHLDLPRHRHHFTRPGLACALHRAELRAESVATTTSAAGLAGSLQYAVAGRWLASGGMPFRVSVAAAEATAPLARLVDRAAGDGDLLHMLARRA